MDVSRLTLRSSNGGGWASPPCQAQLNAPANGQLSVANIKLLKQIATVGFGRLVGSAHAFSRFAEIQAFGIATEQFNFAF